jgi:hypothetical protein
LPKIVASGGAARTHRSDVAGAIASDGASEVRRLLAHAQTVAANGIECFLSRGPAALAEKSTRLELGLFVLIAYRLLSPGGEWRLYQRWFRRSALALAGPLGADNVLANRAIVNIHKTFAYSLLRSSRRAL